MRLLLALFVVTLLSRPMSSHASGINLTCKGTLYPNTLIDPQGLVDIGKSSMELQVSLDKKDGVAHLNPLMRRDLIIPYAEAPNEISGMTNTIETLKSDGAKRIESVHLNINRTTGEITIFMLYKGSNKGAVRYSGVCERSSKVF